MGLFIKKSLLVFSILLILCSFTVFAQDSLGESGEISLSNFNFVTIPFTNSYNSTPIVIVTPVTENVADNNALLPVVRQVNRTHFTIALCKDAGLSLCNATSLEKVNYFVFDADKITNLDWIDVGLINIKPNGRPISVRWNKNFINVPYVFATSQTYNQANNVAATSWVDGITTSGASRVTACTHRGTAKRCDTNTPNETFGYVAIDTSRAKLLNFNAGKKSVINSRWTQVLFNNSFVDPAVMILVNDDNGGEDPKYPLARRITNLNMDVRYCEQNARGVCGSHVAEDVAWFVMPQGNLFFESIVNNTNTTIPQVNQTNSTINNSTNSSVNNQTNFFYNGGITNPNLTLAQRNIPLQNILTPFVDPTFNTTIVRMTDNSQRNGFATQIYSQLQAFSSDNKYILYINNEDYQIYDLVNNRFVMSLGEVNNPRWHPSLPHTIVAYDDNADSDLSVLYFNVDTQIITTHYVFPSQYVRISVNPSFDELSHDGKWMSGIAIRNDGQEVIFAVDLQNRRLGAQIPMSNLYPSVCSPDPQWGVIYPDWTAASPLGKYLVVQWPRDGTSRCSGLETFNIETGAFVGRVTDDGQHGDLGVMPNGNEEFFMTFELYHPSGQLAIGYRMLPGTNTVSQTNYVNLMDWNGEHISCQGPNGECLVSTRNSGSLSPFDSEVFIQRVDGSVVRLAHHRSTLCGYWTQPRATISRDGSKVAFASDWLAGTGTNGCTNGYDLGRSDLYIINRGNSNVAPSVVVPPVINTTNNTVVNITNTTTPIVNQTNTTNVTVPPVISNNLPRTTYNLISGEEVNLRLADSTWFSPIQGTNFVKLAFDHNIQNIGESCDDTNFVKYDVYSALRGSNTYNLVGTHQGSSSGTFSGGSSVETTGCNKGTFVYDVKVPSGTNNVAVCITNLLNTNQIYCTTQEFSTL